MCLYFVRSAPIVANKTASNKEHSLREEETSKSSRTVIQEANKEDILNEDTKNEDILNDETNNEDILNEETSNSEDILNEEKDLLNEDTSNSEDILNKETNNRKDILNQETNNNDTILNGDESVTLNSTPEKISEDVKSSFENKTISDSENYETMKLKDNERGQRNEDLSTEMHMHKQSNEIEDEDFFFHMLNYIMNGENINDEGKPSIGNGLSKQETDETKHSKMAEDKEGNEDINVINSEVTDMIKHSKMEENKQKEDITVVQIKNTTGELIDELTTELGGQQEDSNIKIEDKKENRDDNEKDRLLTENGTASKKDEEIAAMRRNIVNLKKEIESIEEEIELVRKDIKSTVSGGEEENGKTNDTDSSIMDQIWNYFG